MEPKDNSIRPNVLEEIIGKNLLLLFYFISAIFLFSCEEKSTDLPIDFNSELNFLSVEYFPNDSIATVFQIIAPNDSQQFNIEWINPDTLVGWGPFFIQIKENFQFEGVVSDSKGHTSTFQYHILKDTIEFSKYDYRNKYLGYYSCIVDYKYAVEDTQNPGTFITQQYSYEDTVEISKATDNIKLIIDNSTAVDFDFKNEEFTGYHISGKITDSSINYYIFSSPAALRNWTVTGRKMHF